VNEPSQIRELLGAARDLLPASVVATCESLNEHGEWELALSHCRFHLDASGKVLSEAVVALVAGCEARFKAGGDA
jgi:hypothetical protein